MILVLLTGRVDLGQFASLFIFYLKTSFWLWLFLGLIWLFIHLVRNRPVNGQGPSAFSVMASVARSRWEQDRCISALWPPLLFASLLTSFNAFKQMVLPIAGYGFDPALVELDRAIFFGIDPWRVTHAIFSSPAATLVIDRAYHGWFVPMSLGLILCAWLPASRFKLRTQYCLTYIGVWIGIGSILAFAFPSAGPCFYGDLVGPSPFNGLMGTLSDAQQASGFHLDALRNQGVLLRGSTAGNLHVGGGISAMPSVHIALAVLFALGAFGLNRTAGYILAAYAVLIWIGSIHLGWHYAADGLVSGALVIPMWWAAGRVADAFDRAGASEALEPQPA
jgi:hypothetical protein